ncbi:hypothetical protein [Frankia sp. AgB32]|uniref:hypothetical protein n=1 Tax=Frankia sp. AgB32 TaxID=631119 RepID=UPI00200DA631|nr:hypothetical protein [Frankia sp. AgB32]MCK9898291.1 hypothetical protein [Frankia sp. AgB32]
MHLFEEIPVGGAVHAIGRVVKAGRSVLVTSIEFLDEAGRPLGIGHGVFMTAPDPALRIPTGRWALEALSLLRGSLWEPIAQRLGCQRTAPGVASLPCTAEVLNAARTLNGGLIPLVVEEAVLSRTPA